MRRSIPPRTRGAIEPSPRNRIWDANIAYRALLSSRPVVDDHYRARQPCSGVRIAVVLGRAESYSLIASDMVIFSIHGDSQITGMNEDIFFNLAGVSFESSRAP